MHGHDACEPWRASEIGPLCILLDDLHEAESAVLELCDFVARQVGSHAILLVGTYRPDEALRGPDRAAVLARLGALPDVHVHFLDGLPPPEAELLVSARVGEVLPRPSVHTSSRYAFTQLEVSPVEAFCRRQARARSSS